MDAPTLVTLAIVATLVAAPIVVMAVRHRRRSERSAEQDADSMRGLLELAIPVIPASELRATAQARRLEREREQLDREGRQAREG